jgi:glycosyltransferase involved in cell wall biosynthesis
MNKNYQENVLASIIIPVFDNAQGLQVTLKSIAQVLGNRKDIEIIICNDGGGEDISKIAAFYGAREVRLEKNKGSYAARNKGIEASRGEIIAFLDADQKISAQWLDAGLRSLRDADYAGGQIKIVVGDKSSGWELLDAMTAFPVEYYLNTYHFAPTANLLIRKEILHKVGNFNENLRSGGDRDFGVRVFNNGFKQIYVPQAITLHPARNRSEQLIKQKRTAIGYTDLVLIVQKRNILLFILWAFERFFQVPIEIAWRLFTYPILDYWKNNKIYLRFILMKKLLKLIYFWNLITRAFEITTLTKARKIDKT